ncbi:hypothetical protein COS86_08310 [Candidatus Bathyarchaeota archaeon CG07_land_8_20_14_0_80_47_9]|nr:MAG: hypothetical protein COS86_08310 [Candidatus Bathyarchaeota archaeon CG07_land_8_20_14_0_80_47_9]
MNKTVPQHEEATWMSIKACVVCGAPAAGITGYIFFASGHTRTGAPFCKEHLDNHSEYANPVFENREALDVFQKKHPKLYLKRVKGKKILFLQTSQSGTASPR